MQVRERAARLRLMGFDVDGVMTDGSLYFTAQGEEIKVFSSLDGHGLKMLRQAGIEVVIISGRSSRALELRAENLGIDDLYMGVEDKRACLYDLLARKGLDAQEAGYMGDDIVDLPILRICGFSATPADGHDFVKRHVHLVTRQEGGRGAVREVCDFILDAQGRLEALHQACLD
ncbi:MAG: phenylphosphate carboxylase subunit delta [Rhodocyclaceae bacterium]|jgi:3-deoxy-D-manno-octulosonate 8-phosphate phosphatase (KDO 8-P phosphatase)|nr:phenylphosphate carboxylase subunit delta [Rhodocyclaceae bacterium]